jgi:hypothetical protein
LKTVNPAVRERSTLAELDREYSLYEICIITRAGPARILGLKHKGHLGAGADADITIYTPDDNKEKMFEMPRYVIKAGQVIAKIERSFDGEALARIIEPTQISRAGRLLSDYTTTLRGFSPPTESSEQNISSILEALIISHSVPAYSDDDLLSSADDNDAFVQVLLARIGTPPLLKDVEVMFECPDPMLIAAIDHVRFCDLITEMLEDLVGTGATKIQITAYKSGSSVIITIAGTGCIRSINERETGFMRRACHDAGGSLIYNCSGATRKFEITLNQLQ